MTRYLRSLFPDEPVRAEGPPPFSPPPVGASPEQAAAHYIDDASFRLDDNREIAIERWQYALARSVLRAARAPWCAARARMASRATRGSDLEATWQSIDWLLASARGALEDAWDEDAGKLVFSRVNDVDYREWLRRHGADPATLESGLVKFMYYGSFANRLPGDRPGALAADIAVRMVINTLFYKGSLVWKTKKGSGTSLIVPIFEVLRARGVRFRFFHRLVDAVPGDDGEIASLRLAEQARLAPGRDAYDPLIYVGADPDFAPAPDWSQLDLRDAEALRAGAIDLEASWAHWTPPVVHELRVGRDFDDVVLAVPVSALPHACPSLLATSERWRTMVATVPTVGTFAAQLWLRPTQRDLGYRHEDWGLRAGDEPNSVIYEDPVYSWTDMTRILSAERWPEHARPGTLAYFCGTLPDEAPIRPGPDAPQRAAEQSARVRRMVADWLQANMGWFWPEAAPQAGRGGLDLALLAVPEPHEEEAGEARLWRQHFSVNTDPSNLYVLACPGTDGARLRADDSGFSNLYLAGDWTDFGLNVGHLEGAFVSGVRAAIAVVRAALASRPATEERARAGRSSLA